MSDLPIKDRELFLRYAIPCGSVLVDRGTVSQKTLDQLKEKLLSGKPIKQDLGKVFKVGVRMLTITAKRMGRKEVDKEVIRKYFWFEHMDCINERVKTYPDVVPEKCLVLPAKVLEKGLVKTPIDERKVRTDFVPDVKPGDWVTVHYSYIVEKITEKQAEQLKQFIEKEYKLKK